MKGMVTLTSVLIVLFSLLFFPLSVGADRFNVLVVMSYEEDNPWCVEIKEGIDSVLADDCRLTYSYMDTKKNMAGGKQKAEEAYALFQKIRPHGVIAVDDNAQWMFVVPFLKDRAAMPPVMFCGVNADAEKYGYPSSNVSGILERGHIRESLAFAKQLDPSLNKIIILAKDSPSGKALQKQVQSESDSYVAQISGIKLVKSIKGLMALEDEINKNDALFMDSMEGVLGEKGNPLTNREVTLMLSQAFFKPIIGANQYHVDQGALCAVVKTGQEQGSTAADMLLKAMRGTPVSDLPISRNYKGKRVINITTMKTLGIKPRPIVLIGAKLVKTSE